MISMTTGMIHGINSDFWLILDDERLLERFS